MHAGAFAVWAFLVCGAWCVSPARATRRAFAVILLAACAYGFLIEVLQIPVESRHFELSDIVADTVGAFAGLIAWGMFNGRSLQPGRRAHRRRR